MGRRTETDTDDAVLAEQIAGTQALLDLATQEGKIADAVRAQTLLARLTAQMEHRRRAKEIAKVRDPIKRVRMMRDMAEADGSWVAATTLTRELAKLQREARAAQAAKDAEEMAGMSEEEILDQLIVAAAALPAPLRARLRASITDR